MTEKQLMREIEAQVMGAVKRRMTEVGEQAVEIAKETGSYHDVTGRLRASNTFSVSEDGASLTIANTAPYAEDVESRGEIVISTAALEAAAMLERSRL